MYNPGLIGIKAYSLYLVCGPPLPSLPPSLTSQNDLEATTGTILLGGIATKKFTGTLKSIPVLPEEEYGYITHFMPPSPPSPLPLTSPVPQRISSPPVSP